MTGITKNILVEMYINQNMSSYEIAKYFGFKSKKPILSRLHSYEIPLRKHARCIEEIIGKEFGNLKVIRREFVRKKASYFLCRCKCGNEKIIARSHIAKSKFCCNKDAKCHIKDLAGKRFNKFKVISFSHTKNGHAYWNCRCDCGNISIEQGNTLIRNHKRSCGCEFDLIGRRFGYLKVINKSYIKHGNSYWLCGCRCGNTKVISRPQLVSGGTISCGCAKAYNEYKLFHIIKNIFPKNEVKLHQTFDWLYNNKTKGQQHIDIVVFDKENFPIVFVEYDGEQHFKPVRFGSISKEDSVKKFESQKLLDERKDKLINEFMPDVKFVRFNYFEPMSEQHIRHRIGKVGL